jgi:hypothetical protein
LHEIRRFDTMVAKKQGVGGMRPGAGRKPLPLEEKQRNRVLLNLTDAEYTQLVDLAGDEPVSTCARRIVVRYLARRRK